MQISPRYRDFQVKNECQLLMQVVGETIYSTFIRTKFCVTRSEAFTKICNFSKNIHYFGLHAFQMI